MHPGLACRQCSLWCLCALRAGNRYHQPNWVSVLPASKHTSHLNQRQEPSGAGALLLFYSFGLKNATNYFGTGHLKILRIGIGELCHSIMMWSSWTLSLAERLAVPNSIQSIKELLQPPLLKETYLKDRGLKDNIFLELKFLSYATLCYPIWLKA